MQFKELWHHTDFPASFSRKVPGWRRACLQGPDSRLRRPNMNATTKSELPAPARRLVEMMHAVHFGGIEGLSVHDGLPVFDPAPRIVRHIKLGADNAPRAREADFELKAPVRDLFRHLAEVRNGFVRSLEIRHGLPVNMLLEEGC